MRLTVVALAFLAALPACSAKTPEPNGTHSIGDVGVDADAVSSADVSIDAPLAEGAACTNHGAPCERDLLCVQELPTGICSDEYSGHCVRQPVSCVGEPKNRACACDGVEYYNECVARENGYARAIIPCISGGG